ncbi:hypothetical protein K0I62_07660 [Shewanella psychrotolerans]|nr:hypothetical protein K0I62_07660 [Shewanella psychrotolerans]
MSNNTQPLSLYFAGNEPFAGVTIRFDKPWGNYTSPLYLRFNGDVEPPLPVDTTIGIECGITWVNPLQIEQQVILAEAANKLGVEVDSTYQVTANPTIEIASRWDSKQSIGVAYDAPWSLNPDVRSDFSLRWAMPLSHQALLNIEWLTSLSHRVDNALHWLDIAAHTQSVDIVWRDGAEHQIEFAISYRGQVCDSQLLVSWGPHQARWICSTNYRPPEPGLIKMRFSEPWANSPSPLALRFEASPEYCYWDNGGGLFDANPTLPNLDFKIPLEPQVRRSYLMQPQISCIRVSDSLAVVLKSVSISQSRSQWTSSGNVTFSSRIDAERAANELLKITINGYDFYLLCEVPSESKAFGKLSYSASGRGRFAELSAPYVKAINYVNTQARSFMGLMGDIIENMGWTLVSEITDYNVPANAFSYAAKTPAEVLNMMASAIGAMLDIDNETKTITVIPQWPTVPWDVDNAVPDVILHDAVILDFSEKREIRPDANAVFVRGEQQGVAVKVKRTGTAGDNFAADIVDKLITDNQAARMRGTVELANAGNKVHSSIRTKVMADLPPMRPGMLVGVRKGTEVFKSVCDGFTINASVSESTGVVTVNQTVTLLRNEVAA